METKLYKAYVKGRRKYSSEVLAEIDIPASRALDFLDECQFGVIRDSSNNIITREELENAKNISTERIPGSDNGDSSFGEVYEGSGGELPYLIGDNTE